MSVGRWLRWVVLLGLLGLCLRLPAGSPAPVRAEVLAPLKIMPLGDSITSGTDQYASYRCELHKSLVAAGYSVDFVGSVHGQWGTNSATNFTPPDYCVMADWDEEGHSGFRIDDILAGAASWPGKLQTWAAASLPDLVLIHLGTNDLIQNESIDSTVAGIGQVIDTLRAANPHVKILLAQIIPARYNGTDITSIPVFNARLPALAASKTLPWSPILVVDMYTNFFIDQHTVDGIHPNPNGENKMAGRWAAGINRILKIIPRVFMPVITK